MIGKLPILEEKVKDRFLDTLLELNALNPDIQPLKTIRQTWMPEIRRENPTYIETIMKFAATINSRADDDSVRRAIDSLVLGYKILKEQSLKDGSRMPVVERKTLDKVNLKFPSNELSLEITILGISSENPIYWDYFKSTLAMYVENKFVRENTESFGAFCYALLREQALRSEVK